MKKSNSGKFGSAATSARRQTTSNVTTEAYKKVFEDYQSTTGKVCGEISDMTLNDAKGLLKYFEDQGVTPISGGGVGVPFETGDMIAFSALEINEENTILPVKGQDSKGNPTIRLLFPVESIEVQREKEVVPELNGVSFKVNFPADVVESMSPGDEFYGTCVSYANNTRKLVTYEGEYSEE